MAFVRAHVPLLKKKSQRLAHSIPSILCLIPFAVLWLPAIWLPATASHFILAGRLQCLWHLCPQQGTKPHASFFSLSSVAPASCEVLVISNMGL
jgi:hypothetical protein